MHARAHRPTIGIIAWRQTIRLLDSPMTIFQVDHAYVERVRLAGGLPVLLPQILPDEAGDVLRRIDGLLLTGGDDVAPESYGAVDEGLSLGMCKQADDCEIALVRAAAEMGTPILGACRGAQIMNVAFGGTLYQDMLADGTCHGPRPAVLEEILAQRHSISIESDSRLAEILGCTCDEVNTTHHQAIRDLAPGFRVSARAPDGHVEAIESADGRYLLAVQWHPEKLPTPQHQVLFEDLVRAARRNRV